MFRCEWYLVEDLQYLYTDGSHSTNVLVPNSPHRVDPKTLNIPKGEDKAPAPIDPSIDKWFYISGASA